MHQLHLFQKENSECKITDGNVILHITSAILILVGSLQVNTIEPHTQTAKIPKCDYGKDGHRSPSIKLAMAWQNQYCITKLIQHGKSHTV